MSEPLFSDVHAYTGTFEPTTIIKRTLSAEIVTEHVHCNDGIDKILIYYAIFGIILTLPLAYYAPLIVTCIVFCFLFVPVCCVGAIGFFKFAKNGL